MFYMCDQMCINGTSISAICSSRLLQLILGSQLFANRIPIEGPSIPRFRMANETPKTGYQCLTTFFDNLIN